MDSRLFGRDGELSVLTRALDGAERGHGRMMLLAGEAGIGKSRLAAEVLGRARERGFGTLEGRAHPLHSGLAYAPVVEALRPYLAGLGDAEFGNLLDGLADLSRLLADPRLADAASLGDPELERTRMFEAVTHLVARIADRHPVLLFVDDLQWADHGTVELVNYIGRNTARARVLVLATYRAGEASGPLRDLAAGVRRDGADGELVLAPLPDAVVAELARELLGTEPPEELLRGVAARAKGIPLFVTALVGEHDRGGLDPELLPVIVRDVVLARLRRLDEPERRLLEIIAVAGAAGSGEALRAVWGSDGDFEPALRRLVTDALVTQQATGRSLTYRVAHPLYAEVAYAELTFAERRALHAAFAKAIDRIDPDDVLTLAPHYRDAGDLVDPDRAVTVLAEAGWRALGVHVGEEAAHYLGAALEVAGAGGHDGMLPMLLDGLGRAHQSRGRLDEAAAAWSEAVARAERSADTDRQSSLWYRLALLESERGNLALAEKYSRAGSAMLPQHAVSAAAENLTLRMIFAMRFGDLDRLRAIAEEMVGFAELSTSSAARAAVHLGRELSALLANDFATALAEAKRALHHGERCTAESPTLARRASRDLVGLSVVAGEVTAALGHARHFRDKMTDYGVPFARCSAHYGVAMAHYLAGDLNAAIDEIEIGVALARRTGVPRAMARTLRCRAFLLAERGQLRKATRSLTDADRVHDADDVGLVALSELTRAAVAVHSGHPADAPAVHPDSALYHEPHVMCLRLLFGGYAALAVGRRDRARQVVERMRALGRTGPFLDVLADRLDGLMVAADDPAAAAARLASAASRLEAMGAPVLSAQARLEWAELADGDAARGAIMACLKMFERAGIAPWVDRGRRLARSHGIRISVPRQEGALSKRERQVVELVGEGLSNAEIAARLFLSERTIETHLSNSYARLGITSRVALARWAAEQS